MEKASLIEKLADRASQNDHLLGIFVKEPVSGQVKTRLCPPLTPEESARLYTVAMRETVERFAAGNIPVILFYAGNVAWFEKEFPEQLLWPQNSGDLGMRMNEAINLLLDTGCQAAALIGSDSPDLPNKQVATAFAALKDFDAVTIPADDGGYVLVGCSRPCPALFEAIDWSTGSVADQTRWRAERHHIHYTESGTWNDVDDVDSLQALLQRAPDSATARFARQELAHRL